MGSTRAEPRVLAQLTELTILWNNSQMHRECPGKTTPELLSAYGKWWQDGHLERTLVTDMFLPLVRQLRHGVGRKHHLLRTCTETAVAGRVHVA